MAHCALVPYCKRPILQALCVWTQWMASGKGLPLTRLTYHGRVLKGEQSAIVSKLFALKVNSPFLGTLWHPIDYVL